MISLRQQLSPSLRTCVFLALLVLSAEASRNGQLQENGFRHMAAQRKVQSVELEAQEEKSDEDISNQHQIPSLTREKVEHHGFLSGFATSFSVIVVSEFGDRTFMMAAVMATRHSQMAVLLGSLGAMVFMTILSVLIGYATTIIPKTLTHYGSSILFTVFGVKMLMEGWGMAAEEGEEEYEEAQSDIDKHEAQRKKQEGKSGAHGNSGQGSWSGTFSSTALQSFSLTFLAEWGDRSQISTLALAATEDIWGVVLGSFWGNALVTVVAVVAGRLAAQKVSTRTVTLIGGVLFIVFALTTLVNVPD